MINSVETTFWELYERLDPANFGQPSRDGDEKPRR